MEGVWEGVRVTDSEPTGTGPYGSVTLSIGAEARVGVTDGDDLCVAVRVRESDAAAAARIPGSVPPFTSTISINTKINMR